MVHSYPKPGGAFIFTGEHPAYLSLRYEARLSNYVFETSYLDETPGLHTSWKEAEIVILHRKLSTYLNAMAQSGLVLEQIIESEPNVSLARKPEFVPEKWYSVPRAQLLLTRFIEKATKPIFLHG